MVRPLRVNIPGAIYHVMSRGNARQKIFLDDVDRRHFLKRMARTVDRHRVRCYAYCLMPNHFHLILRIADSPLSATMQQLNSAYADWFNARHQRVGHLFQGRYKAPMIEYGEYLRRAVRYVVRNPVRAGLCSHCGQWQWSSYRASIGRAVAPPWLAIDDLWAEFHDEIPAACRAFADYCDDAESSDADPGPIDSPVFGSIHWRSQLSDVLVAHRSHREFTYAERFADRPSLTDLFAQAVDARRRHDAAASAFNHHGYTLREIGDFLGVAPATVWRHARGLVTRWKPQRGKRKDRDLTPRSMVKERASGRKSRA